MKNYLFILFLFVSIIELSAQDYQISFTGTGASSTVGTVKVENVTQGKSITLAGADVLHLTAFNTGIDPISAKEYALRIYPNPMAGNCTIEFTATASGNTSLELFDITGKRVVSTQNTLAIGNHSFKFSGLSSGIYTLRIHSQAYAYAGKLVSKSNSTTNSDVAIKYLGNSVAASTTVKLKSALTEKIMQYTKGDRLKITGTSGNYSTTITDIPTQSKTITFTFVACTDIEGNNYPVVQIGTQIWMMENLKTTKYRNGDLIGTTAPAILDISGQSSPKYQWAYDGNESNVATYGRLYTWFAITDSRGVCPTGWRLPTDIEWTTLTTFLGGENVAGGKLKETGTIYWSGSSGATNVSGYTALPGGLRDSYGMFGGIRENGYWWSSAEYFTCCALLIDLRYDRSSSILSSSNKKYGISVRCIKDESTSATLPVITTTAVSAITSTAATSGGNITSDGGAAVTARGVCWATTSNPTIAGSKTSDGTGAGNFTSSLISLTAGTTYYLRAYATNSVGTAYGNELNFKTVSGGTAGTVTDIDGNVYHTVVIGTQTWLVENLKTTKYNDGTVIPLVTDNTAWTNLISAGYCWYNNDVANKNTYGALYNWYAVNTGKLCPTGWHVPTDAEWTKLTDYLGNVSEGGKMKETGTTHWQSPNTGATNETGFTALPGGYRLGSSSGSFYSKAVYGDWWSSTENNAVSAWHRNINYEYSNVNRVSANKETGYSVRCLKDESASTTLPVITTTAISAITSTTATSGGNITSDGGAAVTARGVCWATTSNPTITNSKTSDGTGTGSFISSLTSLNAGTTYYFRAFATNSVGTVYGNELSFKTISGGTTGTVTDIDGNVYHTIVIGTQTWMVENLKTTKYNDGTSIPNVTDKTAWKNLTTPAYCWYNNDAANKNSYGGLYNWFAVNTGKLCPTGWHVPTDAEWLTLNNFLGGDIVAGGKLKETGTTKWKSPNTGATNETGFTAFPGGYCYSTDGLFYELGNEGDWWSSTEDNATYAWIRYMEYSNGYLSRAYGSKKYGFSVRCIKD